MKIFPDRQVDGPEPLFSPKKGRLFGKSHSFDFVGPIPGNMWLTKALIY